MVYFLSFSIPTGTICEMIEVGLSHPQQKLAAHHFDTIEKALTKKEVQCIYTHPHLLISLSLSPSLRLKLYVSLMVKKSHWGNPRDSCTGFLRYHGIIN